MKKVSDTLQWKLEDREAKVLGDIEDLVVRIADARVTHVVVAPDPSWYAAEGWIALPFESLRPGDSGFVAAFDRKDMRPANERAGAPVQAAAKAGPAGRDVLLADLVGRPVKDGRGATIGRVGDLVLDLQEGRVSHALVVDQPGRPPIACALSPAGLAMGLEDFALPAGARALDASAGCLREEWRQDRAETPRQVRASEMLRAVVTDAAGAEVGKLRAVVVEAGTGRLHYYVADFHSGWLEDGKVAALRVRPVHATAGGLAIRAGLWELRRSPIFEEGRLADVWSPAFAKAMEKYLYGAR